MHETDKIVPSPENDMDVRYAKRLFRTHRLGERVTASLAILATIYMGAYETPILLEEQRLSDTVPSLTTVYDNPNHYAAETIVMGGVGVRNSLPIAESLPQLGDIGAVESVEQDNHGVDAEVIAEKVMSEALASGQTEIGLWGDSIGGLVLAKVGRIIQESKTALRVRFIVLDCTPTSTNSLREDMKKNIELLQAASSIPLFSNVTSHPAINYIYTRQRLETDENVTKAGSHFGVGVVLKDMYAKSSSSSTLVTAEALQVVNPTLESDLKAIADVKSKGSPLIVTIDPSDNQGDKVVNSVVANKEITKMTKESGLAHLRVRLDNITHGDPSVNRQQYQEALTNIILPSIEAHDRIVGSRLYDIDRIS